jgi:hypothetical protein
MVVGRSRRRSPGPADWPRLRLRPGRPGERLASLGLAGDGRFDSGRPGQRFAVVGRPTSNAAVASASSASVLGAQSAQSDSSVSAAAASARAAANASKLVAGWASASPNLIQEGATGRALIGDFYEDAAGMTPLTCSTYCASRGFPLSGLEYSQQCYCGQTLSNGASLNTVLSSVTLHCKGNAAAVCNGYSALSLSYDTTKLNADLTPIGGTPALSASATVAPSSSSSPAPAATLPADFAYASSGGGGLQRPCSRLRLDLVQVDDAGRLCGLVRQPRLPALGHRILYRVVRPGLVRSSFCSRN